MKPTIWIFSIEPLESRYTAQWHKHLPTQLLNNIDSHNVIQIDGIQKNSITTPGAFLNFSDTNYWKSSQLCNFLELHNQGKTTENDQFLFTDAWNPIIIQLKYMNDLLGFNWKFHGMWHAGSYDPADFLGRLIGDTPWVRNAEVSMFSAYDHNYFATQFHLEMFTNTLLNYSTCTYDLVNDWISKKLVKTGWPMEYMADTLLPYANLPKKELIVFPHRIAPEKQVEIFRDLAKELPQYEFVVCQDHQLSKHEYHTILGHAKLVFSANLQETLGISPYEGLLVNAIPMVPNRLSYCEMYDRIFKYPSHWTENYDAYLQYKPQVIDVINEHMSNYSTRLPLIKEQTKNLTNLFFSATNLYNTF